MDAWPRTAFRAPDSLSAAQDARALLLSRGCTSVPHRLGNSRPPVRDRRCARRGWIARGSHRSSTPTAVISSRGIGDGRGRNPTDPPRSGAQSLAAAGLIGPIGHRSDIVGRVIIVTGPLWLWTGERGSWHFFTVPEDRSDEIRAHFLASMRGFKSSRV